VRRIGKVVAEQVGLYSTLTGAAPVTGARNPIPDAPRETGEVAEQLADVLELPRRNRSGGRGRAESSDR
jgi:hypothetical protein